MIVALIEIEPIDGAGVATVGTQFYVGGQVVGSPGSITALINDPVAPGASSMLPVAMPFAVELPADPPTTLAVALELDGAEIGRCVVPIMKAS